MDTIILAGGLGTRLKEVVKDVPKPLAKINDKPFLELLINKLQQSQRIKKIILAIGYKANKIIDYYKKSSHKNILFSIEDEPLGTGGALKKALNLSNQNEVLLMNGDSYLDIDYDDLYAFHKKNNSLLTIATSFQENSSRYGRISENEKGIISKFEEKKDVVKPGYINGGIYLFDKEIFSHLPKEKKFSLEKDFLPFLIKRRKVFSYKTTSFFIDIGIEEDYLNAQKLLKDI